MKTMLTMGLASILISVTACGGPSEAEDSASDSNRVLAEYLEYKWDAASVGDRLDACRTVDDKGLDFVVKLMAMDYGEDTPEFRNAMSHILTTEC